MLQVRRVQGSEQKCIPNVLPCKISYDGHVNATQRHWSPSSPNTDDSMVAHFRGRRLRGTRAPIPEGYQGLVLSKTDRIVPFEESSQASNLDNSMGLEEHDEEEKPEPVRALEQSATFDEIMVWGHEIAPESGSDAYLKGLEEWIGFATQIHGHETGTVTPSDPKR
ncbi:MAG: 3'-5' exonuclease [Chaenotheca gracillima]|nr:MAG: 3'-5' exonuclease [Chaenotheca gracillima]